MVQPGTLGHNGGFGLMEMGMFWFMVLHLPFCIRCLGQKTFDCQKPSYVGRELSSSYLIIIRKSKSYVRISYSGWHSVVIVHHLDGLQNTNIGLSR
jgi:hypothetical protein